MSDESFKIVSIAPDIIKDTKLRVAPDSNADLNKSSIVSPLSDSYLGVFGNNIIGIRKFRSVVVLRGGLKGFEKILSLGQVRSTLVPESLFLHRILGVMIDKSNTIHLINTLSSLGSLGQLLNISQSYSYASPSAQLIPNTSKASIVIDILSGLSHLHQYGVIHGFLCPDNLLVYVNHRVKISDFFWLESLEDDQRVRCWKGESLRYTSSEIFEYVQYFDTISNLRVKKSIPPTNKQNGFNVSSLTDMYSLGSIIVAMLISKVPLANLTTPEDVMSHILSGEAPELPFQYPDKEQLQPLANFAKSCLSSDQNLRPKPNDSIPLIEDIYYALDNYKKSADRDKRAMKIKSIEDEITEYDAKIAELELTIASGRKLIAQKENALTLIFNIKEKRESEAAIEKAVGKLRAFEDELVGIREDRGYAQEDIAELNRRQNSLLSQIRGGKTLCLESRRDWPDIGAEALVKQLEAHCHERDRTYVSSLFSDAHGPVLSENALYEVFDKIGKKIVSMEELLGRDLYLNSDSEVDMLFHKPKTEVPSITTPLAPAIVGHTKSTTRGFQGSYEEKEDDDITRRSVNRKERASYRTSIADQGYNSSIFEPSTKSSPQTVARRITSQEIDSDDEEIPDFEEDENSKGIYMTNSMAVEKLNGADSDDDVTLEVPEPYEVDSDDDPDYEEPPLSLRKDNAIPPTSMNSQLPRIVSQEKRNTDANKLLSAHVRHSRGSLHVSEMIGPRRSGLAPSRVSRLTFSSRGNRAQSSVLGTPDIELTPWEQLEIEYLAAAIGAWDEAIGMKLAGKGFDSATLDAIIDRQETPLHIAASAGHLQVFQRLAENQGFDPWSFDVRGRQPLHCAAKKGHIGIVRYLFETLPSERMSDVTHPADVPDSIGLSPLFYCVIGGHISTLKYLLEYCPKKCSLSAIDPECGATLLHWACMCNQLAIVEYLVDTHYVNIEAKTKGDGGTPFLWACFGGSVEILSFLNLRGAKLNPKHPPRGYSAVHLATASGSVSKTKYLLDLGASMTEVSDDVLNPYDVATGKCQAYLKVRKQEGFVTGSVLDKIGKK